MLKLRRFYVLVVLVLAVLAASPVSACIPCEGQQDSGAVYRVYFPDSLANWNGELVVFAHSYVPPGAPGTPMQIPEDKLYIQASDPSAPPKYLPDVFTQMGYAFAVTSYSKTGLAVVQGVADVVDLVRIFKRSWENPKHVYLVGVSQGGLICTLALEQHPNIFSGGLSLCGPIGDFRRQINYWSNFRVIFDYFFPDLAIPNSPVDIRPDVMLNWPSYQNQILAAISNPNAQNNLDQLLNVTKAATDPDNPQVSAVATVIGLLQYNVFATNDGKATLLGQPFDNLDQSYTGSSDDSLLNNVVQRFQADDAALNEIEKYYQTSGGLVRPLVSMHTLYDPIVPFWQELLYRRKVRPNGSAYNYIGITVNRYGHVNFTADEVSAGFSKLVKRVKRVE